jgi:hypothetical protein
MSRPAKITVELDAEDVAKVREVTGSDPGEPDAAVVQRVLNGVILRKFLDETNARSPLSKDEADRIAVEEVRAYRRERTMKQ